MTPAVRARVERLLDRAAERLLAERLAQNDPTNKKTRPAGQPSASKVVRGDRNGSYQHP